jgi:histidyl-tRNA synthetase
MQNVKGTYDYMGKEQVMRQMVRAELEGLFRLYDYDGMETPILNERSLLASKYAGGDEIVQEMYRLGDQGERDLALRYDLTVPFAKVAAMNPGMPLPFKRYEIGKVFRDGPVKRGRLREFMQCDADVLGIAGPEAEAELMQLAADAFGRLGIEVTIRWNNRRFLGELLNRIGVPADQSLTVMLTLDKLAKIGAEGVKQELLDKKLNRFAAQQLTDLIRRECPSIEDITAAYGLTDSRGASEVKALQDLLVRTGLSRLCSFDLFLSRGLSFYTGTVYEIFDRSGTYSSSLGGGGRYDAIVGKLVDRDDVQAPAAGLSFGMESIMELLREREERKEEDVVLILPVGDTLAAALNAAKELRSAGIRCRLDGSGRKLRKALTAAASQGIRYVMLVGEEEAGRGQVRLKNMAESAETELPLEAAVYRLERALRLGWPQ